MRRADRHRPAPPTVWSRRAGPSHQPREQRAARPSGGPPGASLWGWFRPRGPLKRALRAHRVGRCPAVGQSSTRSRAIAPPLRRSRRRAAGLVPAAARTAQVWAVHIRSAADRVALAARVARGAPAAPQGRLSPADASRRQGVLFSIVLELPTAPRETAKIKVAGGPGRPDEGSIEGGGRRERGGGEQPKRAPQRQSRGPWPWFYLRRHVGPAPRAKKKSSRVGLTDRTGLDKKPE